jgi:hypothetical protein
METHDPRTVLAPLYQPPKTQVVAVDVPPLRYAMIDGAGDPNTAPAFAAATEALFCVAYAVKFALRRESPPQDFRVMPLEGLWWSASMAEFSVDRKADWLWTLMILQPDLVCEAIFERTLATVRTKKPSLTALSQLRIETLHEGTCAQTLHVGPFADEGPAIDRVHAFIQDHGYRRTGKHHEIYLSDFRRADPARWKTILRQPMEKLL